MHSSTTAERGATSASVAQDTPVRVSSLGTALAGAAAALAACGGGHVGSPGANSVQMAASLPGSGGAEPAPPTASEQPSQQDAARFLSQATFGVRSVDEIEALRAEGYAHWLWRQFNAPTMVHTSYLEWQRLTREDKKATQNMSYEAIWQQWLFSEDQLRARVAFALSQILVVTNSADDLPAHAMSSYMDLLNQNAFGNYGELLHKVTLHPTMGYFLNMATSEKENAARGIRPNENYAREILQLFSIGLVLLNPDGSPQLDAAGAPIPSYGEDVVLGFAKAFTGWTFASSTKNFRDLDESLESNWFTPMRSNADYHSSGPKLLLQGVVLPAGGSPEQDVAAAVANAFNHPNVGPFIGRQLIQRLVTSNPSPAYIARVTAAFDNNGQGVRGDLRAVVSAILLDPEARDPSMGANGTFGKQREPVVRFANVMRGLGASSSNGLNSIHELDNSDKSLGQSPLLAPTVFNFYLPSYMPAGAIMQAGLVAPEFQITTESTVVGGLNFFAGVIKGGGYGGGDARLKLNFAPLAALASNPTALVDRLNLMFFNGQMSSATRTRLTTLLEAISPNQLENRVKSALIVTTVSPDFVIQT
jgi:uncharacterized protein (DUF1800 family)